MKIKAPLPVGIEDTPRIRERIQKALTRCTCEFKKDDYGAPQIIVCEACSEKINA